MVEHDLAARHLQGRRPRLVGDLGRHVHEAEHALHVHQRIADLAIGEAQHVQGHVELDQEGVDRHEVAQRHGAGLHAIARHDHDRDQPARDDGALPDIEQRERPAGADGGLLVAAAADVEAARLVLLVAEVLHRLVVEEAVDRLGVGLGVGVVHAAHELDAPFRQDDREGDVAADGGQGHRREAPVVEAPQHRADQVEMARVPRVRSHARPRLQASESPAPRLPLSDRGQHRWNPATNNLRQAGSREQGLLASTKYQLHGTAPTACGFSDGPCRWTRKPGRPCGRGISSTVVSPTRSAGCRGQNRSCGAGTTANGKATRGGTATKPP